jgi:hypothetical protein
MLASQQRNEAFVTWRQVTEARNAARYELDIIRYRRLEVLSLTAWRRYERRCELCRITIGGTINNSPISHPSEPSRTIVHRG